MCRVRAQIIMLSYHTGSGSSFIVSAGLAVRHHLGRRAERAAVLPDGGEQLLSVLGQALASWLNGDHGTTWILRWCSPGPTTGITSIRSV